MILLSLSIIASTFKQHFIVEARQGEDSFNVFFIFKVQF